MFTLSTNIKNGTLVLITLMNICAGARIAAAELSCMPQIDNYALIPSSGGSTEAYISGHYCKGANNNYRYLPIYDSYETRTSSGDFAKSDVQTYTNCEDHSGQAISNVRAWVYTEENLRTGARTVKTTTFCNGWCNAWFATRYCQGRSSIVTTSQYCHDVPGPCPDASPSPTPSK